MMLSHYTTKPLTRVVDTPQPVRAYTSVYDKPKGLWLSVDGENDWPSWCEDESYGIGALRYRVVLAPDANVLHISRDTNIYAFQKRFGTIERREDYRIEWDRVADVYDGIIIAPYHWESRMSMSWYYPWDCASGCIWKARAIKRATLAVVGV